MSVSTATERTRNRPRGGKVTGKIEIRRLTDDTLRIEDTAWGALCPVCADGILKDGGNAEVVTKGSVWVNIDQDVVEGTAVFVRISGGNQGYFRADVDGGAAEAVPGARFEKDATAVEGIALLDINLPA